MMKDNDIRKLEAEKDEGLVSDEPQGWCSPEFPSGCILDSDLE